MMVLDKAIGVLSEVQQRPKLRSQEISEEEAFGMVVAKTLARLREAEKYWQKREYMTSSLRWNSVTTIYRVRQALKYNSQASMASRCRLPTLEMEARDLFFSKLNFKHLHRC